MNAGTWDSLVRTRTKSLQVSVELRPLGATQVTKENLKRMRSVAIEYVFEQMHFPRKSEVATGVDRF